MGRRTAGVTASFLLAAASAAAPSEARADDILVFQQQLGFGADTAGQEAETLLEGLGHTVTLVASTTPVLPDLAPFDTVYFTQAAVMSADTQNAILAALAADKGVYVSGESSPTFDPFCNSSIQNLFNQALLQPVQLGNSSNAANALTFNATAGGNISTTPNALTSFTASGAGRVHGAISAKNTLLQDASNIKAGAVFPPEDLDKMSGCAIVVMDLDWWTPAGGTAAAREAVAENFQTFLNGCADSDDDGVSDPQEAASATGTNDPDSDDDGLCDGYGTGNGTCIPGDGVYEDFDGDTLIDPLDPDDDNDGVPTSFEAPLEVMYPNVDGDDAPTWEDLDSDGDGYDDMVEGENDYNMNGIPAIVEIGDFPMPCDDDSDCGGPQSGMVCDDALALCTEGCRGQGGNGCPTGETCTSTDNTIGDCIPDGTGGGGTGGSGPSGSGSAAAGTTSVTAVTSTSATGGGEDDGGEDDGCSCRSGGTGSGPKAALVVLGLALLLGRRASSRKK